MGFSDQRIRTIKCDNPDCPKVISFDLTDAKKIQETEWLKGVRMVQTGDGRSFSYCSDVCEVKGITTGQHNLKEPPKQQAATPAAPAVIPTATDADVKAAAQQSAATQQLEKDLKSGDAKIVVES
jgi:hypothetical protein